MATTWLVDADGRHAPVSEVKDRDRYVAAGWTAAAEPGPADRVWTRHGDLGTFAAFAAEILPVWQARGWEPAAPPMSKGDVGPFVDLSVPVEPPVEPAPPAPVKNAKEKING